ncbi:MAG: RNA polymerase sigma-70 factor [Candidatus Pedobacter colombiensis]|uniref:RNA polymerase sigma-70 factor n=1 Tax=Candidatus Pedobacter colombiensis TaxID=3121371 RepID=A0AAJ6B6M3_9SPHI|nr:RNA polymerase sigma-70 factor [Pedobacter sp.]WEK18994.1 MAG: RNA polymerase sigma-70 factor [Pedobacter sp.]
MLIYGSLSDLELTDLLKEGDVNAYTVIYNRYFDELFLHAFRRLNDKEEAQDVIHELFAGLWNKRAELTIRSSLAAYLYTSVRNRIMDVISHLQVETKYVNSLQNFIDQGYCITDHRVRERQLSALIEKGIAELPPKMREVFELSRKQVMSHKEIAAQLNISEQTVRKQVNNALKILRSKLGMTLFLCV